MNVDDVEMWNPLVQNPNDLGGEEVFARPVCFRVVDSKPVGFLKAGHRHYALEVEPVRCCDRYGVPS